MMPARRAVIASTIAFVVASAGAATVRQIRMPTSPVSQAITRIEADHCPLWGLLNRHHAILADNVNGEEVCRHLLDIVR
jgi:hypothetical protein